MKSWRLRCSTPALAGVVLCGLLLTGCATPPQSAALQRTWPAQLPQAVLLDQVPFHPQEDLLCGPATLAMVAQAAGASATPEQLTPQVYLPGRQGALQTEMLAAARRGEVQGRDEVARMLRDIDIAFFEHVEGVLAMRLDAVQPSAGVTYELDTIAAVVITLAIIRIFALPLDKLYLICHVIAEWSMRFK